MSQQNYRIFGLIYVSLAFVAIKAHGWGSYGHEQINSAAVGVIADTPLGKCLKKNSPYVIRLAITPDMEWKFYGVSPTNPMVLAKKKDNDKYEHPLHYFEPDAFITPADLSEATIGALPASINFKEVVADYQKRRTANAVWVEKVDPAKKLSNPSLASSKEVAEHGTAPWRVVQLYHLAVESLKKGDVKKAMFYMGTMGHYVGDIFQPFHATINYDGKYFLPTAKGIHSVYESKILEEEAKKAKSKQDKSTLMWSNFNATEPGMMAELKEMSGAGELWLLSDAEIVLELVKKMAPGLLLTKPLMQAYTMAAAGKVGEYPAPNDEIEHDDHDHCRNHSHEDASRGMSADKLRIFMGLDPFQPGSSTSKVTVLQTAVRRMTESSAFLARLWLSAYEEAKASAPLGEGLRACPQVDFDVNTAIMDYPKPDYLPE